MPAPSAAPSTALAPGHPDTPNQPTSVRRPPTHPPTQPTSVRGAARSRHKRLSDHRLRLDALCHDLHAEAGAQMVGRAWLNRVCPGRAGPAAAVRSSLAFNHLSTHPPTLCSACFPAGTLLAPTHLLLALLQELLALLQVLGVSLHLRHGCRRTRGKGKGALRLARAPLRHHPEQMVASRK